MCVYLRSAYENVHSDFIGVKKLILFFNAVSHNWEVMKTAVNNYISSLNWGYRVSLRDKNVNYVNSFAEFVEPHKVKVSVSWFDCSRVRSYY